MRGRFWIAVVAALLFLGGCGKKEQEPTGTPLVKIVAGAGSGSGMIYTIREEEMVIVTAGHVLTDLAVTGQEAEVTFWDGFSVTTGDYVISRTSETAFLNVPLEKFPEEKENVYPCVTVDKESFDGLSQGAVMALRGLDGEGQEQRKAGILIYPWIYVEDFAQDMMLVEGECVPGMSGGGLFDAAGNYVGILCGVNENRETAVVPLSVVFAEYAQEY